MANLDGGQRRPGNGGRRRAGGDACGDGGQAFRYLAGGGSLDIDTAHVIRPVRQAQQYFSEAGGKVGPRPGTGDRRPKASEITDKNIVARGRSAGPEADQPRGGFSGPREIELTGRFRELENSFPSKADDCVAAAVGSQNGGDGLPGALPRRAAEIQG